VERLLVLERAVQVRIEEHDPSVGGLHHHDGKRIGVGAIAVHIRRRQRSEWQLAEQPSVPARADCEPSDPRGAAQRARPDRERAVRTGAHGSQRDAALAREITQVEHLGRPRGRHDQAGHARVDARVEDADEHAAAIVGLMRGTERVDAGARERHEAGEQREGRRQLGIRDPWR
jgi:hypothetical protein